MPTPALSWLSTADIMSMMEFGDLEPIRRDWRLLVPRHLLGLGTFINTILAPLPGLRRLCLRNYVVARPTPPREIPAPPPSCSVLVPCRMNGATLKTPSSAFRRSRPIIEVIFIEGHSSDNTFEECKRVRDAYPDRKIRCCASREKAKAMQCAPASQQPPVTSSSFSTPI